MGKMQEEADGVNLAHVPLMLKSTSWHGSEKKIKAARHMKEGAAARGCSGAKASK